MSELEPAAKRACVGAVAECIPWHTVVISNFGDERPEETVVDELATFLVDQGKSVTSYVVLPDCGAQPFFLANYRYLYDKGDDGKTDHPRKGQVRKQYVKEMIPSTTHLRGIASEVMFIFSHGSVRNAATMPPQPGYLVFVEPHSVAADGRVLTGNTPASLRIWSCAAFKETWRTYRAPSGAVTLSQVVSRSDLVFLLSCNSEPLMQEYSLEDDGRKKPDFVVFLRSVPSHDISFNIFLALLTHALETRVVNGQKLFWDDVARLAVCQVILWVKEHGEDADKFWDFLETSRIILPGQSNGSADGVRINGCLHTYGLRYDEEAKKHDKLIILDELKSLTLMIWHDGRGVVPRGYDKIDQTRPTDALTGWIDGGWDLRTYIRAAPAHEDDARGSRETTIPLDALLLQLRDLASGA